MGHLQHIHLTGHFTIYMLSSGAYEAHVYAHVDTSTARIGRGPTPHQALSDALGAGD